MQKEKYHIIGMSCVSCSSKIENQVSKLAGVSKCNVNLLSNSMEVEFNEELITNKDIIEKVISLGYEVNSKKENSKIKNKRLKENEERKELEKKQLNIMKKRVSFSLLFMLILMYVSMGDMLNLPNFEILKKHEHTLSFALTQFLLVLPIMYINKKYYEKGFKALFKLSPNMDSLVALSTMAAFIHGIFSLYIISFDTVLLAKEKLMHHRMDLYFESIGMILTLITIGKYFETKSKNKTNDAINKLIDLSPKFARLIKDGIEIEVEIEEIQQGDIIIVRPGEAIPIDGFIIEGSSEIDEASISGEPLPVLKKVGDKVLASTINKNSSFKFRASTDYNNTVIANIINLVEEASSSKAPIAKLADKVSLFFVPIVLLISLASFLVWIFIFKDFSRAFSSALAVLLISCPCALGLATPLSIMLGTGLAAKNFILIKNARALQILHSIDTVLLDKTGTITEGKPKVTDIIFFNKANEKEVLSLLTSIEKLSTHPIANAILEYTNKKDIDLYEVSEFKNIPGEGLFGYINSKELYVCSLNKINDLLNKSLIKNTDLTLYETYKEKLLKEGKTLVVLVYEEKILSLVAVLDEVKKDSKKAIEILKSKNIKVGMITGDNEKSAKLIADKLGIDELRAEVLPKDKEEIVSSYIKKGNKVAMVGDGINDAPALARADLGIAIGAGTDIAIEAADIILSKSNLLDVVKAIEIGKKSIRNIKQNLFWAFFYNILCIPVATGILVKPFSLSLSPMWAAFSMSLSSLFVVSNALRLSKIKFDFENKKEVKKMIELKVEGMMCEHCKNSVYKNLINIEKVEDVIVNLQEKTVKVISEDVDKNIIINKIKDLGYEVLGES